MKTFIKKIFWILGLFFLFSSFCYADIILENTHFVKRCVKIMENPELKNVSLLYKITGPMVEEPSEGVIEYNTCLHKGYKFNQFELFAQKDGKKISLGDIQTRGGYVNDANPVTEENISYQVVVTQGKYKLKEIYSSKKYTYTSFWKYLLLTIVIETLVLFLLIKKSKLSISYKKTIIMGGIASGITFPVLWFFRDMGASLLGSFELYTLVGEISVVFIETILLKHVLKISWNYAICFSFLCNLASYLIGLFL